MLSLGQYLVALAFYPNHAIDSIEAFLASLYLPILLLSVIKDVIQYKGSAWHLYPWPSVIAILSHFERGAAGLFYFFRGCGAFSGSLSNGNWELYEGVPFRMQGRGRLSYRSFKLPGRGSIRETPIKLEYK